MNYRISSSVVTGIAILWVLVGSAQANQPLALVGGNEFGRHEVQSIMKNVLDRELPEVIYEDCGEFLAPEDYSKYRMVVLAGPNSDRRYTKDESMQIEDYVRHGGNLVLIGQSPKMFSIVENSDRDSSYLFGRSYFFREKPTAISVFHPDAEILQGAFEHGDQPSWLEGSVMLRSSDWDSFIGQDDYILVGQRTLEKGNVYYLGSELFRLLSVEKVEGGSDVEGWVRILKNILSEKDS